MQRDNAANGLTPRPALHGWPLVVVCWMILIRIGHIT